MENKSGVKPWKNNSGVKPWKNKSGVKPWKNKSGTELSSTFKQCNFFQHLYETPPQPLLPKT